jgi:hypothetical protein
VVAGVEAIDDAADEPALAAIEDRQALRPVAPRAAGELVDLVAGLAAEELFLLAPVAARVHASSSGPP